MARKRTPPKPKAPAHLVTDEEALEVAQHIALKYKRPPALRIVASGSPTDTKVYVQLKDDEKGALAEIDISSAVRAITFTHEAGDLPRASVSVFDVNGEFTAILDRLEREILPPPPPKTTVRMTIFSPERRRWRIGLWRQCILCRCEPMGGFGEKIEGLYKGWMRDSAVEPVDIDEVVTLFAVDE